MRILVFFDKKKKTKIITTVKSQIHIYVVVKKQHGGENVTLS